MSGHLIASFVNRPRKTADLLLNSAPGGMIKNTVKGTMTPNIMPGLITDTTTGKSRSMKGHMDGHCHLTRRTDGMGVMTGGVGKSSTRTATKVAGKDMGANIYPGR